MTKKRFTIEELHTQLESLLNVYYWDDVHSVDQKLADLGLYERRYAVGMGGMGMRVAHWLCDVEDADKPVVVFTYKEDFPSEKENEKFRLIIFTNAMDMDSDEAKHLKALFAPDVLHPDIKKYIL